ncbi:M9 family metallopeptidase [Photobacterium sp. J15]|uniref:M9 family metallopeptidase n=1 Tax=Photobacterium sp. J15 TaxID=265901 RepID=UPI0007E2FD9B|nr:M9 family metallopeptidase [Photobacterium sp. J15]
MSPNKNIILGVAISLALLGCNSETDKSNQTNPSTGSASASSPANTNNNSNTKIKPRPEELAPISIPVPPEHERMQASNPMMELDSCREYGQFSQLADEELFNFIKDTSSRCISELYRRNDKIAVDTFQPEKIIDIAQRAARIAPSYNSSEGDDLYNLFLFLRGGFYVEGNNKELTYQDKKPHQAMNALLQAYSRNPYISATTDMQGNTLSEYFAAWDSSKNFMASIDSVTRYLNEFSPAHLAQWSHRNALTSALRDLYHASWDAEFTKAAEQHTALRQALLKVANSEFIYNSEHSYEAKDALSEYGRFLEYYHYWKLSDSFRDEINNGIVDFMSKFDRYSDLWAKGAGLLESYNRGQCDKFNICGWQDKLRERVLSIDYTCSDTINIQAQEMTQPELQQACSILDEEEKLFHKVLNTGNQPVEQDFNTDLEVNVFNSGKDYKSYAGILFGIDTNNGGMYLEGNPADKDNQARFIAHEATWRDDILVWNLRHEYVHYLDGRFNLFGSFSHFKTSQDKVVWWTEGLAEYISHQNHYDEAINFARKRTHSLSEIFSNNYDSGTDRIYRWGYLAVRFMFENAPESVNQLLEYARKGDVKAWVNYIDNTIGTSLDEKWYEWLETVPSNDTPLGTNMGSVINNGSNSGPVTTPIVQDSCQTQQPKSHSEIKDGETICTGSDTTYYFFYVNDDVTRIDINSDHGDGNLDLYYNSGYWAQENNYQLKSTEAGNTESLTVYNPTPGWHYLTSQGAPTSTGASLKVTLNK